MSLKEYHKKRNFRRTPEPQGNGAPTPGQSFVIQKHAASRLHYDFRLELDGTLKSWAVPKGPSLDPAVKTLAVHVEDHPLDYASFEGIIPQGEYGGGTVMVWDHGTWESEGDAAKGYKRGKLSFTLHGKKLRGKWTLVRMGGQAGEGGKNWLLIKKQDKAANKKTDILTAQPKSVVSGREMSEIAADADRVWESNGHAGRSASHKEALVKPAAKKARATSRSRQKTAPKAALISGRELSKLPGAKSSELPAKFKPQLAVLASDVPSGDDWLHELKFDGYRMLAFLDRRNVRLITRNGKDWTKRFAPLEEALAALPLKTGILDGEVVSLNKEGLSNFQQLQNLLKRGNSESLVYYLFDVPYLNGYDLTKTPLVQRKEVLARLLLAGTPNNDGLLRYSDHIQGQGRSVLANACRYAMEGVVSKQADSPYQQFRSPTWLKIKCLKRQEFVIGGYTKPGGSRTGFGALLLGHHVDGRLVYSGRVGTGFSRGSLRQLSAELKNRRADAPPFANPPQGAAARGVTWVRPELVCEVEFTEWTEEGLLRHPSFQGRREDKPPEEITREEAKNIKQLATERKKGRPSARKAKDVTSNENGSIVAGVHISNPNRVLYPEQSVTKLDLAKFYENIADWILPYVVDRPLTMVRCPQGRAGACFYQKHMKDSLPETLRSVSIREKSGRDEYVVVDDLAGLVSLVQIGVLEIHPWSAHTGELEKPDQMIFDLDPGPSVKWADVVAAARDVRKKLNEHKLKSFVRTSGGKGLHVVVPLKPVANWDDVKEFARAIAHELADEDPKRYVATMTKSKRGGKVFIDFFRNSRGATAIASYSTRARAGAPVATPLRWDELGKVKSAEQYNVNNLVRRLATLRKDPWDGYFKLRQTF